MSEVNIIEYSDEWLKRIETCDWPAAKFLASLLRENKFAETLGGWAKLYLLVEGEFLISFATLSAQDCVADNTKKPWIGFLYTLPEYRGNRYAGRLLDFICGEACNRGYHCVWLGTDHIGFYEKYSFRYIEDVIDIWGENCRVYVRNLKND